MKNGKLCSEHLLKFQHALWEIGQNHLHLCSYSIMVVSICELLSLTTKTYWIHLWIHSALGPKIESVCPWTICAQFKGIPSRCSWDVVFTRMETNMRSQQPWALFNLQSVHKILYCKSGTIATCRETHICMSSTKSNKHDQKKRLQ